MSKKRADILSKVASLKEVDAAIYGGDAQLIDLKRIMIDDALQIRLDGLDEAHVESLKIALESNPDGLKQWPVVVFRLTPPDNRELLLAAGFHRMEAHRRAGLERVWAIVKDGSYDDALEFAENSNLEHGRPLSSREKKHIVFGRINRGVTMTIADDVAEWGLLAAGVIAREIKVSTQTAASWLEEYQSQSGLQNWRPVDRTRVLGNDGKWYETENVKEANARRAAEREAEKQHIAWSVSHMADEELELLGEIEDAEALDDFFLTDDYGINETNLAAWQEAAAAELDKRIEAERTMQRRQQAKQQDEQKYDGMRSRATSVPIPTGGTDVRELRYMLEGKADGEIQAWIDANPKHPHVGVALSIVNARLGQQRISRVAASENETYSTQSQSPELLPDGDADELGELWVEEIEALRGLAEKSTYLGGDVRNRLIRRGYVTPAGYRGRDGTVAFMLTDGGAAALKALKDIGEHDIDVDASLFSPPALILIRAFARAHREVKGMKGIESYFAEMTISDKLNNEDWAGYCRLCKKSIQETWEAFMREIDEISRED